ncbi:MAG: PaaI family thioesterase [Corynebacterium sp.]|uniref:PaaI family thioesterase n=1 Tax=unclassified Corynebacterium TaxID=2624378 RepID=UPI003F8F180F
MSATTPPHSPHSPPEQAERAGQAGRGTGRRRSLPVRLYRSVESYITRYVFSTPRGMEQVTRLWPPLAGSGIRLRNIADDWSRGEVVLRLSPMTRTPNNAAFGGTLFAMTDILFGTLVMRRLGSDYEAWTRTGTFQFLNPGQNGALLQVEVDDDMVAMIRQRVRDDGYLNVAYTSVIRNPDGTVVGIGQQDLHVRPRKGREASREFATDGSSTPRSADESAPPYDPTGITLASLVTAVAWKAWGGPEDRANGDGRLNSVLSHARRIPVPEDRARYVCAEVLADGAMTRDEVIGMRIPESLLP